MSAYTYVVRCDCVESIDALNEAILSQDEAWEGLKTAEQIISINWNDEASMYIVFWRERKWL